jgi:tetratricopeptide (TPR) repeat protein
LAFIQGAQREIESAKQLYELVKEVQKQLVEKSPRISQYQDDLARTYYNLGDLYRQSDKESAKTAYQQAVNRWRDLTERHPDVLIFQRNLADALCRLSMAYSNTADTRKAEELANQAIGILSGEHKSDPQFRDGLAQAYIHRGNVLRKAKNAPLAEGNYQQAQEILQELVKTHPEVPQYQNELANCLNDRGLLEEAEKEKAFRGALELWQRLHKNYPEDLEFALGVNTAARNLGDMLAFNKDPKVSEGALDCYRQALAALAPQDQNPAVRDAICKTYTQRAMFYVQLKSPLAQEDWNQAFLFAREPTAVVRYYRAMFLSQEREHVGAVALADSLVDDPNMSREGLFQLACIYARCCAAATPDAMLSLGPNSKSEGYADSSLKCLYKARELGYFKNPRNLEKLKKPDLDSLRQRMDFQRFLSEVEPPGGAGVKP